MNWIKCSERLPERRGDYLIYYIKTQAWWEPVGAATNNRALMQKHVESHKLIKMAYFNGSDFNESPVVCCDEQVEVVTHWMPLPEPPKDE